jgi:hypothetical protein
MLAATVPALNAASISYDATLGCGDTCVTVYLEWANLPAPVSFVEVDDLFGNFIFALNTPFPPVTTGAILPDPQTISGLSPSDVFAISNGAVGIPAFESFASFSLQSFDRVTINELPPCATSGEGSSGAGANLVLKDASCNPVATVFFVAVQSPSAVPEPETWALAGAGLAILSFFGWRRKSQAAL